MSEFGRFMERRRGASTPRQEEEVLYCPECGERMFKTAKHDGVCPKGHGYADWNPRHDMLIYVSGEEI